MQLPFISSAILNEGIHVALSVNGCAPRVVVSGGAARAVGRAWSGAGAVLAPRWRDRVGRQRLVVGQCAGAGRGDAVDSAEYELLPPRGNTVTTSTVLVR